LFDPAIIPQVMENGTKDRKPIVGVIHKSGTTPHPPVRRAIKEAAEKLKMAGFHVKDFTPPDFNDIRNVTKELFTLDSLSYPRGQLEKAGEPVVPSVQAIGFWDIARKTHEQAWALNAKKLALQKEMLDRWQEAGIDIVLAPAGPHTAVLPGDWTIDMYTVAWNAMDVCAIARVWNITNSNDLSSIQQSLFLSQKQTQSWTPRTLHSSLCMTWMRRTKHCVMLLQADVFRLG
jgi:amidase